MIRPRRGRSGGCSRKSANRNGGYLLLATDVAHAFQIDPRQLVYADRLRRRYQPRALALFTAAARRLVDEHQVTVLADLLVHRLSAVRPAGRSAGR